MGRGWEVGTARSRCQVLKGPVAGTLGLGRGAFCGFVDGNSGSTEAWLVFLNEVGGEVSSRE